jgi:hypothetical protein
MKKLLIFGNAFFVVTNLYAIVMGITNLVWLNVMAVIVCTIGFFAALTIEE